jgi:protoheme IX farnesyltransferase
VKDARADTAPVPLGPLGSSRRLPAVLSDYVALTKPRLNLLVVATSAAGYYLGSAAPPAPWSMAEAVCGTALVAAGSAVLNQVYERDTDALMRRTRRRPLPDGRVTADEAGVFGVGLAALGILLLVVKTNGLAALLALATLILYVVIYTPLKRRSEVATLVGAIPGALPPLIGWAAAHGSLSVGGWVLFAIVFLWQIPHFMAISWLYREDYGKAGFPMLAVIDPAGRSAGRQAFIYAWALFAVSLLPTAIGLSGRIYLWIALLFGAAMVWLSWRFATTRTEPVARALFIGSIVYLPLIWVAMILNH